MKLPNGGRAVVAALGLGRTDADWLRERLLAAAVAEQAEVVHVDRFGTIYVLDFLLTTAAGSAGVRSGWIVRYSEDFPRLTTCYVRRSATL